MSLDCHNRLTGLTTSCAPSPRTVARSSASASSASSCFLLKKSSKNVRYNNNFNNNARIISSDDDDDDDADADEVDRLYYQPRRSQPIVHPPSEIPFCENCRVMDEEMSKEYNHTNYSMTTGSPVNNNNTNQHHHPHLLDQMIHDDEDESRSWVMRMPIGPWWCEDCQESVTSTNLSISQLFAILRQWTPYAQLQLITIVEEIFRRGAHVDDRDGLSDMTLLHFAAKSGALGDEQAACRIANYLLDEGANLEARCKWTDMTPLHYAAYFDCPILADLLIHRGACISARASLLDNSTPLHLAASQLSLGTARILIQAADFSVTKTGQQYDAKEAKDGCNRTPYECLPPSGQLPEPLCTLRDLLAELLRPTSPQQTEEIDIEKKILQATSNDTQRNDHLVTNNYVTDQSKSTDKIGSVDEQEQRLQTSLPAPLPPQKPQQQQQQQSTGNGVDWLVAESGFLSPRTKRPPTNNVQQTSKNTNGLISPPPTPTQLKKFTISAKVTLQSMGLALGDRVCIAPGNSTPSSTTATTAVPTSGENRQTVPPPPPTTTTTGISGRIGKLRYCGSVSFASGIWVGVELDEPVGRNNGSVAGIQYFSCPNQHGIFAPIGRVYKTVNMNGQQNWHPISLSTHTTTATATTTTTSSTTHTKRSMNASTNLRKKEDHSGTNSSSSGSCNSSITDLNKTPKKRIPSSRSSYAINSSTGGTTAPAAAGSSGPVVTTTTTVKSSSSSQLSRTPTPPAATGDFSHVTPKIDTGLRIRSPPVNDNDNEDATPQTHSFQIGDRILVAGQRKGILRFIGETQFAPGTWYGIELDQPVGKNNGSINGIRYFDCNIGHGIFAPINRIQKLPSTIRSMSSNLILYNRFAKTARTASTTTAMINTSSQDTQQLVDGGGGGVPMTTMTTTTTTANTSRSTMSCQRRRAPWSSTTSPMIGRAVIGRPPLPIELVNALKAVGRGLPTESVDEPVFYLTEGMQVLCAGEIGIVRYIGPITFAEGTWLGIELRKPCGRHDGCVAGRRYFTCRPGHGLLIRPNRVFCHGINALDLLPPALAELERQLAAKRHELAQSSSKLSSANSINSGGDDDDDDKHSSSSKLSS
ncbi:unnamed protein product [Schistosoma turkestanicum]|nr:unnamed protein product [Schistosoma turkestanicum]